MNLDLVLHQRLGRHPILPNISLVGSAATVGTCVSNTNHLIREVHASARHVLDMAVSQELAQ